MSSRTSSVVMYLRSDAAFRMPDTDGGKDPFVWFGLVCIVLAHTTRLDFGPEQCPV